MEDKEKNLEKAKETFKSLCAMLDEDEWSYDKDEDDLVIRFTARGEDIPMDFIVIIDPHPGLIRLLSYMPFQVGQERMIDTAIAICAINFILKNGTFEFDINSGMIGFRMTQAFFDSSLGSDIFKYLVYISAHTVDEYNDKLLMISKGNLPLNDFLKELAE